MRGTRHSPALPTILAEDGHVPLDAVLKFERRPKERTPSLGHPSDTSGFEIGERHGFKVTAAV